MTRAGTNWSGWCVALLAAAVAGLGHARGETAAAPSQEQELIAVLRSETPESEKALAFKNLAIHGSPACVEAVAT